MKFVVELEGQKWLNASNVDVYVSNDFLIHPSDVYMSSDYNYRTKSTWHIGLKYRQGIPIAFGVFTNALIFDRRADNLINYDEYDESVTLILDNSEEFYRFKIHNNYIKTYNYLSAGKVNNIKLPIDIKKIIKHYCRDRRQWNGKIIYQQNNSVISHDIMLE